MASPVSDLSVKSGAGEPSSTGKRASVRRAVGVVRVSRLRDHDGDRFVSPREQTERIRSIAERDALELVDAIEPDRRPSRIGRCRGSTALRPLSSR